MLTSKTSLNTYVDHSLSNPMIQFYLPNGGRSRLLSLPICPRCERTGLRDKGWIANKIMACPHCGYRGKATHQLSTYLKEGCYK